MPASRALPCGGNGRAAWQIAVDHTCRRRGSGICRLRPRLGRWRRVYNIRYTLGAAPPVNGATAGRPRKGDDRAGIRRPERASMGPRPPGRGRAAPVSLPSPGAPAVMCLSPGAWWLAGGCRRRRHVRRAICTRGPAGPLRYPCRRAGAAASRPRHVPRAGAAVFIRAQSVCPMIEGVGWHGVCFDSRAVGRRHIP